MERVKNQKSERQEREEQSVVEPDHTTKLVPRGHSYSSCCPGTQSVLCRHHWIPPYPTTHQGIFPLLLPGNGCYCCHYYQPLSLDQILIYFLLLSVPNSWLKICSRGIVLVAFVLQTWALTTEEAWKRRMDTGSLCSRRWASNPGAKQEAWKSLEKHKGGGDSGGENFMSKWGLG